MALTNQGIVSVTGTVIAKAKGSSIRVDKIIINNTTVPYTISLYKYNHNSGSDLVLIYKYDLDAGDSVVDTDGYLLNPEDYIKAFSSVANTTFIVESSDATDI